MKIAIVVGLVICAAQGIFGASVCPAGWTTKSNACYKLFTTVKTVAEAQLHCISLGSTLAEPLGAVQNGEMKSAAAGHKVLIGLNDINEEGKWRLFNGADAGYFNWHSGEPNNANNEDCVEMYDNGKWNDIPCSFARKYMCQMTTE